MGGAALKRGHYPPLESGLDGKAGSRREPEGLPFLRPALLRLRPCVT